MLFSCISPTSRPFWTIRGSFNSLCSRPVNAPAPERLRDTPPEIAGRFHLLAAGPYRPFGRSSDHLPVLCSASALPLCGCVVSLAPAFGRVWRAGVHITFALALSCAASDHCYEQVPASTSRTRLYTTASHPLLPRTLPDHGYVALCLFGLFGRHIFMLTGALRRHGLCGRPHDIPACTPAVRSTTFTITAEAPWQGRTSAPKITPMTSNAAQTLTALTPRPSTTNLAALPAGRGVMLRLGQI